jgi:hypothetical protein
MATTNAPIDPDVKIPDAVRRAAARVEEIYNTQPQDPGNPEANQQAPNEAGEGTGESTGEQQDNTQDRTEPHKVASAAQERANARRERARAAAVAKEHANNPEEAPAEGEAQPQERVQERTQERVDRQEDTWERKYNAMKGRFDHANNQLHQLSQQVAGLQNVISTLQQPQAPQEQTTAQQVQQVESMLTQEEREQYGDEFLGVVAKKAHEIVGPLKRELEEKIKRLDSQVGNVNQHVDTVAKDRMFASLDKQVPDWRDVNNDPNFVQWLQLPDAYTGAIRHNLLKAAFNQNDSGRVAAFFNGFLAEEAATAPQGQPRDQGAPPSHATNGAGTQQPRRPSLDTLAAPGRAKSAAAQAPAEKPIFTRAQIAAFYTNVAAGKYEGREKEKDKTEAQIFSAQQEGRIRN